jgi:hypothetical protein
MKAHLNFHACALIPSSSFSLSLPLSRCCMCGTVARRLAEIRPRDCTPNSRDSPKEREGQLHCKSPRACRTKCFFCTECGRQLMSETAKFCSECGSPSPHIPRCFVPRFAGETMHESPQRSPRACIERRVLEVYLISCLFVFSAN